MPPLVILPDLGNTTLDTKTVNGSRDIIRELFEAAGLSGGWRMKVVQQAKGSPHLKIKLTPQSRFPLILTTQPNGNDSAWEWKLAPNIVPTNFEEIQTKLRDILAARKVTVEQPAAPSVVRVEPPKPPATQPDPKRHLTGFASGAVVDQFAEKYAKATELVALREALRQTLRRIDDEQLSLLERQHLLEQQAKDAQAALDSDTAGLAAEAFLESYKVLLQSTF
jgi:hypothetical protein